MPNTDTDTDTRTTIAVTLDITLRPYDYTDHHDGELVADTLPGRLTARLRECSLFARDQLNKTGVIVELADEQYGLPLPDSSAWLTARLTWHITLDADAWAFYWGLPPHRSVAAHVAVALGGDITMRQHYGATVAVVPPPTLAEVISDEE